MIDSKITCPVCSTEKTGESTACAKCGFEGAYYTLFSGEKAYNMWKSLVEARKSEFAGDLYIKKREKGSELLVTSDRVCFYDAENSRAVMFEFSNDQPQVLNNVKQVSLSSLHSVWLNDNGTLGLAGDDELGQRQQLERLIEIISVATTAEGTYAVRADGTVASCGAAPLKEKIDGWTDIKSLCCAKHVIGIKNDSTVVYAVQDGAVFGSYASVMNDWKNVRKVVSTDYYAMALCNDGSVLYAGAADEKSQCANWKNIVDIAADGQYAIGLTQSGDILLAGENSPFIDFGRSKAADWKDVVFIAAGRSLIAGLTKKGELKLVGNVLDSDDIADSFKNAVQSKLTAI